MSFPVGLIAGKGELPLILARRLKSDGRDVVAVAFDADTHSALDTISCRARYLGLGQVGKVIETFLDAGVKEVALVGKVDKRLLFGNPRFDMRAVSLLKKFGARNDDSIMSAVVAELEGEGFSIASQAELFREMMPGRGVLSGRAPDEKEKGDIEFGMKMARGISALDIGQTVIVRDKAVVAVEAIEGTDEAIERGGRLAKKQAVVCKVSKPAQDPRFDVPTVGVNTVKIMIEVKATALAIEAGATVAVDLPAMIKQCDRNKISFVAV